ncbi:MAG TPA: ADP-ribosylglycohydrolase family protein, partial [Thioploca sp.]|nr:ADP-ribosylglycohydrolase family protein [Thioploca sp.]
WEAAWEELEVEAVKSEWNTAVDVRINGAYVYMGLLYGGGDYWKTMNVSMRCGRDSDCNPSSAVGILGTALGLKNAPAEGQFLRDLPINNISWENKNNENICFDTPQFWNENRLTSHGDWKNVSM